MKRGVRCGVVSVPCECVEVGRAAGAGHGAFFDALVRLWLREAVWAMAPNSNKIVRENMSQTGDKETGVSRHGMRAIRADSGTCFAEEVRPFLGAPVQLVRFS